MFSHFYNKYVFIYWIKIKIAKIYYKLQTYWIKMKLKNI